MTKYNLRQLKLAKRNALTPNQIQTWSTNICTQIINSQEFQTAKVIHIYKSFGSEVQTEQIIQRAFEANKIVVIPEVMSNRQLKHWQVFASTIHGKDKFGIEIPIANRISFDLLALKANDLVIIPIIAFDSNNNRIGYGKGFYDKFLTQVKSKKLGIAFKPQLVENFEPDPWDVALDQIIQNENLEL